MKKKKTAGGEEVAHILAKLDSLKARLDDLEVKFEQYAELGDEMVSDDSEPDQQSEDEVEEVD